MMRHEPTMGTDRLAMQTNWIGNRATPSASDGGIDVVNPADENCLAVIPAGSSDDVERAVTAARAANAEWSGLAPVTRRAALFAVADKIMAMHEELARLITQENGKPLSLSRGEVAGAAGAARMFAELSVHLRAGSQLAAAGQLNFQQRFPRGVVGCIVPWNYPVALGVENVSAAIAVGNTVVWKPSEKTPLSSRVLVEKCFGDLPPGVVNLVLGDGRAGAAIVEHPEIDAILFVGSEATGRRIGAHCGGALKKAILELGGKDALIVDDTADVEKAAALTIDAAYFNAGQLCTATERVYVARSIFEPFVEALVRQSNAIVQGDGLNEETGMGPLVDDLQLGRVVEHVSAAKAAGATVHCGGGRLGRKGYFYPPTVLTGMAPDQPVMVEETFGPVAPIVPFDDFEEALALANGSRFGLAGVICTNSSANAIRALHGMRAGMLKINMPPRKAPGGTSEPVGASGLGHGYGQELLHELTRQSSVQWRDTL